MEIIIFDYVYYFNNDIGNYFNNDIGNYFNNDIGNYFISYYFISYYFINRFMICLIIIKKIIKIKSLFFSNITRFISVNQKKITDVVI